MILKGVIRKYIFAAAEKLGIEIAETPVSLDALESRAVDGLFITGTSIGALPVSQVDGMVFQSPGNPVIGAIRTEYETIVREYLRARGDAGRGAIQKSEAKTKSEGGF
jgi:branched-subunit amino acid aminotransferase/4-amino-4-deoxychorismate lyase